MSKTLPQGWQRVRLGEFLKERNGFIALDDSKTYKRITVRLHNKGIEPRDEVPGFKIKTKKQKVVKAGDLVVAEIDAKVGGFGIAPAEAEGAIVSSHYFLFTIDQCVCELGYLDACIRRGLLHKQVAAVGSTNYAAVRPSQVLDYRIYLPPLAEQKLIDTALRALVDAIEASKEVIACKRSLKRAMIDELLAFGLPGKHELFKDSAIGRVPFSWEIGSLRDLLFRIDSGSSPKCEERPARPNEWGVLKVSAVTGEEFLSSENKALSSPYGSFENSEVKPGDVILARGNGSAALVGKPVYVATTPPRLLLSDLTYRLVPNPTLLIGRFLTHALRISGVRKQIDMRLRGTSGIHKISKSALREVRIPIPSREEQEALSNILSATDESISIATQGLSLLTATRDKLTGALVNDRWRKE